MEKLVPSAASPVGVALKGPPLASMTIGWYCQFLPLMGPLSPFMVTVAFMKSTGPKSASGRILRHRNGASTIHSAELRAATTEPASMIDTIS